MSLRCYQKRGLVDRNGKINARSPLDSSSIIALVNE